MNNKKIPLYFEIDKGCPLTKALMGAFNQIRDVSYDFKDDFERYPQDEAFGHMVASADLQLHQLAEMIEWWDYDAVERELEREKVKKQTLQNEVAELQKKIYDLETQITNLS